MICTLSATSLSKAQKPFDSLISASTFLPIQDSLQQLYGKHKIYPEEYALPILIALSRYPELADTRIRIISQHITTTMAARPVPWFIFQNPNNRQYKIFINNDSILSAVLLAQVPFNAQVGVLGHELGHVLDYEYKTNRRIIWNGLLYLVSDKFKHNLERHIDEIAIAKGFGWQIYHFARFVMEDSEAPPEYKAFKRKIYYSPKELLLIIRNNRKYKKSTEKSTAPNTPE